jgi:NAD(P)-dependent dehydrogenase (short-subunit alcohol dehydrogenase family)
MEGKMREEGGEPMGRGRGMFDLSGRVALVTGGASGLGKVFCEALAEFGADVAIADIDEAGARQTAGFIEKLGRRSLAVRADVSYPDDVQQMVNEAVAKLGTIDILVNNAGITARANRVAEIPINDWDRVIAVDLRGVFLCTRAVLPVMQKQGKGNIINIASVYGIKPFFEIGHTNPNAHYAAAKAGVISLTKSTALDYAKDGIRVNCIAPGWYRGTRLGSWMQVAGEEERRNKYEETIARTTPMGRRGDPTELKGLIVYIASDASSFVTGQVFISDGGISI